MLNLFLIGAAISLGASTHKASGLELLSKNQASHIETILQYSEAYHLCPNNTQTLQTMISALNQLDIINNHLEKLNNIIAGTMILTLITLIAYVPLMYTTVKQILAAQHRINQIAPAH